MPILASRTNSAPKAVGRGLAAAAALVCVLFAPAAYSMTAEQYFEDGNRLYRDDLYWAALLRYRQAREAGMDSALLQYNIGIAHYRAGQHIRARTALSQAIESPSLKIAAQYNLGINAYEAGNTDEALRWLRAARDQQQNPTIADYARAAIARIRGRDSAGYRDLTDAELPEREKRFADLYLNATASFGVDNNVFRSSTDAYIDFSDPRFPIVIPDIRSGAYMPLRLSAKYTINTYRYEGFFGAYRLVGRLYQDKALENANEYSHELSFGNEYRRKNEDNGRERRVSSAFTVAQHDEYYYDPDDGGARVVGDVALDDRFDYLRYGPELDFRQSWDRLAIGFDATAQLWNYETTGAATEYDHEFFRLGVFAQYRFMETSLLRFTARKSSRRFGDRRARDLDGTLDLSNPSLRYDYLDLGLLARQRVFGTLWFGAAYERSRRSDTFAGYNDYTLDTYGVELGWQYGRRFDLKLRGNYRLYDYPRAFAFNNAFAGQKALESADASIRATYRMTPELSLLFEAELQDNVSSDTRLQFERSQYVLGVRWRQ